MKRKPSDSFSGKPAITLLDEAVTTLKRCSFSTWLCYYAGTAPFILALLYFWAEMSAGAYADRNLASGALGMAVAFVWMKCWQSVFADRLMASLAGNEPIVWTPGRIGRLAVQQTAVQGTSLYLLPLAALIAIPYGWVYAFYHKFMLEGTGERGDRWRDIACRSADQAKLWPLQNHVGISWLVLVWLVVFLNVLSLLFVLPFLLKTLFGVETLFSRSHYSLLNTTVLMIALGLTHLIVDPVVKTFYLLRCFYGRARLSGVDLKVSLRRMKATALVLFLSALVSPLASASETAQIPSPMTAQMNERIDRVLERPEYAWRAPRVIEETSDSSLIGKFLRATVDSVIKHFKPMKKWIKAAMKWVGKQIENWFKDRQSKDRDGSGSWLPSAPSLVYGLCGMILLVAGWIAWRGWRKRRRTPDIEPEIVHAIPDIRDEHLTADQLPEDRLIAEGELRLGLRAMYLAGLAHLGVREMVTLNRAKSNQEYRRELGRRARMHPDLVEAFSRNVGIFERAWYGEHPVTGEIVADYTTNLERIRSC
jgi:hypothetical protein